MSKHPHRNIRKLTAATLLSIAPLSAHAGDYDDKLLGDMAGIRPALASSGVDLGIDYVADAFTVDGGTKDGDAYLHTLNVVFDVDSEKLFGLKGNKMNLNILNYAGGNPNSFAGSVEGVTSLEAAPSTTKIYELWTEQSFADDKASVLLGLYDLNSEFFFTEMTANFIKPTMEVSQEVAQTGQNGPSIFPTTSLAARFKYMPSENLYVQAAIMDGEPGNSDRARGTRIDFEHDDGALYAAEIGHEVNDGFTKFALGYWRYSKKFDDQVDVDANGDAIKQTSQGVYAWRLVMFTKATAAKRLVRSCAAA